MSDKGGRLGAVIKATASTDVTVQPRLWLLGSILAAVVIGWAIADLGGGGIGSYLLAGVGMLAVIMCAWSAPEGSFVALMSGILFQNWFATLAGRGTPLGETISRLDDYLLVIFVLTIMLRAVSERRRIRLPFLLPIAAYLAIGMVSAFMHAVPMNVAVVGAYLAIKFYVVLVAATNIKWGRNSHRLPRFVLLWGAVGLVVGALQFVLGPSVNDFLHLPSIMQTRAGVAAVTSVFVHPGYFGWFMAVCGVIAFTAYLEHGSRWYLPLGVLFVLGVVMSLRVKPLLGLVGVAPLAILMTGRGRSRGLLLSVVTGLVVVAVAGSVVSDVFAMNWKQYVVVADPSQIARNALYAKSWEIASDAFPLGAGFGRYGTWMSVAHYSPVYARYGLDSVWGLTRDNPAFAMDTFWPGVLGEAGWFGGLFVAVFVGGLIWVLMRRARAMGRSSDARFIHVAAALVLLEGIFESLGSPLFVNQPSVIILGALAGLALSLEGQVTE